MPRATKTKVLVEIEAPPKSGIWAVFSGAPPYEEHATIPEAEAWVEKNIDFGMVLRIVKISGVFRKEEIITKRQK